MSSKALLHRLDRRLTRAVAPAVVLLVAPIAAGASWPGYAHDAQHTAISPVASQALAGIRWDTPVDLDPQYSGGALYAHYGSPLFTPANTAVVPVKTGATGGFRVDGRSGATGTVLWTQTSDYILPPHNWKPPFAPALTPANRMYMPAAGGTLLWRDAIDSSSTVSTGRSAFFGDGNYNSNPSAYNSSVFVNTPITSDPAGNLYFGYRVTGTAPLPALGTGGIARISASGVGTFVTASDAAGVDPAFLRPVQNCAPALSNDGSTLYIAMATGTNASSLVAVNAATLGYQAKVALKDPVSGNDALAHSDGTSSPTIGPDGTVFYGVLGNPPLANNYRGWMLQFSPSLVSSGSPGGFGWDITPSIVPASMVTSYSGESDYLILTKYNNYKNVGTGDGNNKMAVLDPNDTQIDSISGATVMKEILTISGVTPDPTLPAVREWCVNTAVVDPATNSALVNSEDGKIYRWDLTTNSFTQSVTLTPGLLEAYTPTLVAPDGTVYAINDATLFGGIL